MNTKDLRKLSRSELLEMLVEISEENETIKNRNNELQRKLENRKIDLSKAGTIAEAAMQVNGVFAAAQAASEQYLENIKRLSADAQSVADSLIADAKKEGDALRTEARAEVDTMRAQAQTETQTLRDKVKTETDALIILTERTCDELKATAQRETDARWAELKEKLDHYVAEHDAIMRQFSTLYGGFDSLQKTGPTGLSQEEQSVVTALFGQSEMKLG